MLSASVHRNNRSLTKDTTMNFDRSVFSVLSFIVILSFRTVLSDDDMIIFEDFLNEKQNNENNFTVECKTSEFRCLTKTKCIPLIKLCDGKKDCRDSSDESIQCRVLIKSCPSAAFRCAYGACIDGKAECDGKSDCADNSDENTITCLGNKPEVVYSPPLGNIPNTAYRPSESGPELVNTPLTVCSVNQFVCSNGECIEKYALCDGTKHCSDGSDETRSACSARSCPYHSYRCSYGACVHRQAQCNDIMDCVDGSDEDPKICRKTTESPTRTTWKTIYKCALPRPPRNGRYAIRSRSETVRDSFVEEGTYLKYSCDSNFALSPSRDQYLCSQGQWAPSTLPSCISTKRKPWWHIV